MTGLADWLRSAELEVARLNFEAIQSGISAYVGVAPIASLPDLIRLACRKKPRGADFLDQFRAPFREQDPTLLLEGEDELASTLR